MLRLFRASVWVQRLLAVLAIAPVLCAGGLYLSKEAHRHAVRRTLAAWLPAALYETVSIARPQLAELRFEHDFEFEWRGEMFDIVSRTETPDSIHFVVWRDTWETEQNERISSLLSAELAFENMPQHSPPGGGALIQFYSILKHLLPPGDKPSIPALSALNTFPSVGIVQTGQTAPLPPEQPPKFM